MPTESTSDAASGFEPKTHTITIEPRPPVAFAVPGVRKARQGDFIQFDNQTEKPITLFVAAEGVLKAIEPLCKKELGTGISEPFEVVASSGTHELSIHYSYWDADKEKQRSGFAIGASSPKIIIIRP